MKLPKIRIAILAAGLLAVVLMGVATAALETEVAKLTAVDAAAGDFLGSAVAFSGDTAVVGAPFDDDAGDRSGSAYVFVRSAGTWSQQAKLTASDAAAVDLFGETVAISGDTVVVGARGSGSAGSAYVFVRSGGTWSQQQKLTVAAAGSFGFSVAVSGDTALVGDLGDDDVASNSGAVYVFFRSAMSWSEQAKLKASDPAMDDWFGHTAALNGDTAVVGAQTDRVGGFYTGSAYVFFRSGGVWSQQEKLTADDAAANDEFSHSLAISDDTAVVGAPFGDDGGKNSGSAYVFSRSAGSWSQQPKLTAGDARASDSFGWSVAVSGDTVVVGARADDRADSNTGSAYVFVDSGGSWSQEAQLTASDAAQADFLGTSVAVSGDTVLAGVPFDDDFGSNSGSVYVFGPATPVNTPPVVTTDQTSVTVDEGQAAGNTGTVSDADGDPVTLTASLGVVTSSGDGTWSWSFTTNDGPVESQTVTISADDGNGGTASVDFVLVVENVAPSVGPVIIPTDPVNINDQPLSASGPFSDPAGSADATYSCTVDYGDGFGPLTGTVQGSTCTGLDQTYAGAGVYEVTVAVTDKDGGTGSATATQFIVIYDPAGGFVSGGGWIDSPSGAYIGDPTLTGKGIFGFVSRYKKGQTVPSGNTKFMFKAGDLNFDSTSYEWMVIAGSKAMYKGSGTINDAGNFGFQLSAIDEALTPSTNVDLFGIRIFDKDNDDAIVYDNKVGETGANADPTTALGGGSIKIHKPK